jgi:hypothetical protein
VYRQKTVAVTELALFSYTQYLSLLLLLLVSFDTGCLSPAVRAHPKLKAIEPNFDWE